MIGSAATGYRDPVPGARTASGLAAASGLLVLVLGLADAPGAAGVGYLLPAGFALAGGVALLVRGVRRSALYRVLLGAALVVWAAGEAINGAQAGREFPGPGDAVMLAAGPLGVVGGLLMMRVRLGDNGFRQFAVDCCMLGPALALPVWQFGFTTASPPAWEGDGGTMSLLTALCAVVALTALVGGAFLAYQRDPDRNLLLVAVGMLLYAGGDLLAMYGAIVGRPSLLGMVGVAAAWPLVAAGLVSYRPEGRSRGDRLGLGPDSQGESSGVRLTTAVTLALLLVSLVALVFDATPDRSSIGLVALVIAVFGARELLNANSRRALVDRLQEEATADPLTGLANRRVLAMRMRLLPVGEPWCLLTVDLDGFKDVNDLLGHAVGDDLLRAVARRLTEAAPADALICRIGGDEFAVLLAGDIDVGERVGGAIVTAVRQSAADVEGVARVEVSASVGVAAVHRGGGAGGPDEEPTARPVEREPVDPAGVGGVGGAGGVGGVAEGVVVGSAGGAAGGGGPDGKVPEGVVPEGVVPEGVVPEGVVPARIIDLRDHAARDRPGPGVAVAAAVGGSAPAVVDPLSALSASGAALRVAKAAGRNRVEVYDEEIATIRRRRLRVEERLRAAVETDAITVRFQPIVDLRRGVVAGAEALARWTDDELGRVDPGEFITVAEQTGLVVALGERVLEETLRAGVRDRLFERGLRLSWNVSPVQLRVAGFDRVVHEAISAHGVPRDQLVMEVTEQVLVEEGQAAQTLRRIAKLGVTIAIDDFGTGYSALGYLHRLPADILKIDQSLTSSLVAEPRSRAITRAVLDLGRTVGLSVVVEGVESDQIHDLVRRMGIGYGQGMHYGPAMTGPDLAELTDRLNTPTG